MFFIFSSEVPARLARFLACAAAFFFRAFDFDFRVLAGFASTSGAICVFADCVNGTSLLDLLAWRSCTGQLAGRSIKRYNAIDSDVPYSHPPSLSPFPSFYHRKISQLLILHCFHPHSVLLRCCWTGRMRPVVWGEWHGCDGV